MKLHKLRSVRGVSRLAAILAGLILVLVVLISIPTIKYYYDESQRVGCRDALSSANRIIKEEYMLDGFQNSAEAARDAAEKAMLGWTDMCPAGGSVYLAERPGTNVGYEVVCGMHDPDAKERTRLNASNAMKQLEQTIRSCVLTKKDIPDTITVQINSKDLIAQRTDEDTNIKRGTSSTSGVSGTVLFFSVEDNRLSYLCYADEDHCAVWRLDNGWTGDSYIG